MSHKVNNFDHRVDFFKVMVGLIFSQLYDAFPISKKLNIDKIAEAMYISSDSTGFRAIFDGSKFELILNSSLIWLKEEGFLRSGGDIDYFSNIVLTARAFTVIDNVPLDKGQDLKLLGFFAKRKDDKDRPEAKTPGLALRQLSKDIADQARKDVVKNVASSLTKATWHEVAQVVGQCIAGVAKGM